MAEALIINDTTYAGEVASYMITRAVVGADTIQKGAIMVQDGIKKVFSIPRVEVSNFMQKRQATPTSQGSIVVDRSYLTPQDSMLYVEFNPRDFEQHWYAVQLETKLIDETLPQTAEAYITMQMMKRLNEFFENGIWQSRLEYDPEGSAVNPTTKGAPASASAFYFWDGLIKKALDDTNTIEVGSPVALTGGASGNIITKFQAAYELVPKALLYKYGAGGLKFLISYADQQKYESTMQLLTTFKNQDTTQAGINRYNGYDVVPCAGIPENTFFVCIAKPDLDSNLWLGINSMEDMSLQLARLQNNSELYFLKGLFKTDTAIGFADQLVIYTTQTA
jgi:hypothetical protein